MMSKSNTTESWKDQYSGHSLLQYLVIDYCADNCRIQFQLNLRVKQDKIWLIMMIAISNKICESKL